VLVHRPIMFDLRAARLPEDLFGSGCAIFAEKFVANSSAKLMINITKFSHIKLAPATCSGINRAH